MKRLKLVAFVCFFVSIVGCCTFLFLERTTANPQWQIVSRLDQVVTNLPTTKDRPQGWFLQISKATLQKDYDAVVAFTKQLTLFPKGDKEVTRVTNPQTTITKFRSVYQDAQQTDIRLEYTTSSELIIMKPASGLAIGGVTSTVPEKLVQKVTNVARNELASFNGQIFPITDLEKQNVYVAQADLLAGLALYKQKDENILKNQNFGFEQGLWQVKPDDCSNTLPGTADISSRLFKDGVKEGRQAISLASKNHFACIHKRFEMNLETDCQYQVSFAYKNRLNGPASYYLELKPADEKAPSSTKKTLFTLNESMDITAQWSTWSRLLKPTWSGKTTGSIYFYAPSNGKQSVEIDYDDVRITSYCPDRNIAFSLASLVSGAAPDVSVPEGESLLQAEVPSHQNLLQDRATFKDGIWGLGVQDCSNQKPGEAAISASVIDALGMGKVANLTSTNHYACISKVFDVNLREDMEYRFSVDARSIKGNKIQFFYSIEGEAPHTTSTVKLVSPIAESSSITTEDREWHTYTSIIADTPPHPKKIRIYLYAPSDGQEIENQYTNIRLLEYQPKNIHDLSFIATQATTAATGTEISVSHRWYGVDRIVVKGERTFLLTNLTSFSRFDKLRVCESSISERHHYVLNESSNLWLVGGDSLCTYSSDSNESLVVYYLNGKRVFLMVFGLLGAISLFCLGVCHFYSRRKHIV